MIVIKDNLYQCIQFFLITARSSTSWFLTVVGSYCLCCLLFSCSLSSLLAKLPSKTYGKGIFCRQCHVFFSAIFGHWLFSYASISESGFIPWSTDGSHNILKKIRKLTRSAILMARSRYKIKMVNLW